MEDFEKFFKRMEDIGKGECMTVEELYQAFKQRLISEVEINSEELIYPVDLSEK